MVLQITAISITHCSLKHKGLKPLQRPPVSSLASEKAIAAWSMGGVAFVCLFAVAISGVNCLITSILSF